MATPVIAIAVPHGPDSPRRVADEKEESKLARQYRETREQLEAARPDVIIELTSDHFVNFFLDKMPAFAVAVVDKADGPHESWRTMPWYEIKSDRNLADALLEHSYQAGYDLAGCEEVQLDHSALVPLHFLTPRMDIPVVPVYLRGFAYPLPTGERCYAFGKMLRQFVENYPGNQRVAVIASGSLSLEIGGPRVDYTDEEWMALTVGAMKEGKMSRVPPQATGERLAKAGNVAGESLNWVAVWGFLGDVKPEMLETQAGNAFATWQIR